MVTTVLFIAFVILAGISIYWAIGRLVGAFAPGPQQNQIMAVVVVTIVLIGLVLIASRLGIV